MQVTFDEEKHIYRDENGFVVPSVTQIISLISSGNFENIKELVLSKAAERGTEVHRAIELYNKMDFIDNIGEYQGYLEAYIDWCNKYKPKVLESEVMMCHPAYRYAGTIDLICEINGMVYIVDFKTTAQIDEKIVNIQLMAYKMMAESKGYDIAGVMALQLKKDGYNEFDAGYKEQEAAKQAFESCLMLYYYYPKAFEKIFEKIVN